MTPGRKVPVLRLHNAAAPAARDVSRTGNTAGTPGGSAGTTASGPAESRPGDVKGVNQRASAVRPALRLAESGEWEPAARQASSVRRKEVLSENRLASGMSPDDARWIFARRVAEQLEGGTAALLTPERRRSLLATSQRVGLRDFDANLIIAIVQDGRRSGKGGLNPEVEHSLLMVTPADPAKAKQGPPEWIRFAVAGAILGTMMAWMLTKLISG